MALSEKGNFSYLRDDVNFVVIDGNLTARIERINNDVARLYIVGTNNVQVPVPPHIQLVNETGAQIAPFMDNFLIIWIGSYALTVNGQIFLKLGNQRQQLLSAPDHAPSGTV
eukprot:TRINITY_DN7534_c0_g1_i1.p2 TRINITY_DN7534_c0_g1~~TRINITY_DN7534_c0_g1_i1.p2  ORF type:complete len:112 (+),score=27.64 TRINITY_DN7534_c0_g1_i1:197-532(+)